ncbi:MAG: hypothetical protein ABIJ48_05750 [Actinomycetota bacterium]
MREAVALGLGLEGRPAFFRADWEVRAMMSTDLTRTMGVRALFGLIGLGAGVAGGWLAYSRTRSWALAVFVGVLGANLFSRGVADIITDPQKGRRLVFFTLPTLLAAGGVAGGYLLWDRWWAGVLVGGVLFLIGQVLVMIMFPRIAAEEAADSASRMGLGGRPQPRVSLGKPNQGWPQDPYGDKHF